MNSFVKMRHTLFVAVVMALDTFLRTANAQVAVSGEALSFRAETAFEPGAPVSGELRIPESKRDRLPAVLILHSSVGIDGTGASYAEVLNQAGIATLEIEMWQIASGGRPVSTRFTMPHAYGSLLHLSGHPRIDPNRIGVMGFSWGGIMSGLTSSAELTQQYGRQSPLRRPPGPLPRVLVS